MVDVGRGVWGASSICGMVSNNVLRSLWFVASIVVVVDGREVASRNVRIRQWSSGEFIGMKVGMRGSPMCSKYVSMRKSDNGMHWES